MNITRLGFAVWQSFSVIVSVTLAFSSSTAKLLRRHIINTDNHLFCSSRLYDARPQQQQQHEVNTTKSKLDNDDDRSKISIELPQIHWTVPAPGYKVGWTDENGSWFDEDGPRDGPPMNYWRQRVDEKQYAQDMDVVNMIVMSTMHPKKKNFNKVLVELTLQSLEKKNSARWPLLNRKLLGRWAPLLRSGVQVASSSLSSSVAAASYNGDDDEKNISSYGYDSSNDTTCIDVPMTIDIYRTAGRKLRKNRYGVFDASLVDGEEITIQTSDGSVKKCVSVNKNNKPIVFGAAVAVATTTTDMTTTNYDDSFCSLAQQQQQPLYIGGITYISDYILIQRGGPLGNSKIPDVWLRCDDSYLGRQEFI